MSTILRIISAIISVYTFLCFIRILLTWIPGMSYNKFTNFLASICDPYLNLFRNIKWLTVGNLNFSPALALCLLGAVSMLLTSFSHQGRVTVGLILALLVQIVWTMIHSIAVFFMILLLIRFIMLCVNKGNSDNFIVNQIDYTLKPLVYRMTNIFSNGKTVEYKTALIIAFAMMLVLLVAGNFLISFLTNLIQSIPF